MIILINGDEQLLGATVIRQAPTLLVSVHSGTLPSSHGEYLGKLFWYLWQWEGGIISVKYIQNLFVKMT